MHESFLRFLRVGVSVRECCGQRCGWYPPVTSLNADGCDVLDDKYRDILLLLSQQVDFCFQLKC